jgi:hypothetical protein
MAPKGCPETSVRHQHTLSNNPEERRPGVHLVLRLRESHTLFLVAAIMVGAQHRDKTCRLSYKFNARNILNGSIRFSYNLLMKTGAFKLWYTHLLHASVLELT